MEIPLNLVFAEPDGRPMLHSDGKGNVGAPITVKDAVIMAAVQELPQDAQSPNVMQEKLMRFGLYQKLIKAEKDTVEFTTEELAHLKDRLSKIFGVLIYGPLVHLFEGKSSHGLITLSKPAPQVAKASVADETTKAEVLQ